MFTHLRLLICKRRISMSVMWSRLGVQLTFLDLTALSYRPGNAAYAAKREVSRQDYCKMDTSVGDHLSVNGKTAYQACFRPPPD